jgi:hypothetical protein
VACAGELIVGAGLRWRTWSDKEMLSGGSIRQERRDQRPADPIKLAIGGDPYGRRLPRLLAALVCWRRHSHSVARRTLTFVAFHWSKGRPQKIHSGAM